MQNFFVNLNGGADRVIGRRLCNDRIMCRNGMICESHVPVPGNSDTTGCNYIRRLNAACEGKGIPFVAVIVPTKVDAGLEMFPDGWNNGGDLNAWAHACCEDFKAEGIAVVDLTSRYTATPEDVRRHFFRTDHHWNVSCVFDAVHVTANELARILDEPSLMNHPYTDSKNWEWRTLRDAFLGSHGRRTGEWFSGRDDYEYAVPLFKTHMARKLLRTGVVYEGAFEDAAITKSRIEENVAEQSYSIVGGGDRAWQELQKTKRDRRMHYWNFQAPCDKRVLISGDSFRVPFAAYLATLFKEILVNDPRNMPPGLDEEKIISGFCPDVVIRIVYVASLIKGKWSQANVNGDK